MIIVVIVVREMSGRRRRKSNGRSEFFFPSGRNISCVLHFAGGDALGPTCVSARLSMEQDASVWAEGKTSLIVPVMQREREREGGRERECVCVHPQRCYSISLTDTLWASQKRQQKTALHVDTHLAQLSQQTPPPSSQPARANWRPSPADRRDRGHSQAGKPPVQYRTVTYRLGPKGKPSKDSEGCLSLSLFLAHQLFNPSLSLSSPSPSPTTIFNLDPTQPHIYSQSQHLSLLFFALSLALSLSCSSLSLYFVVCLPPRAPATAV